MLNICCKLVNFKIIFIFEFKKYKFINNYYFILFKLKNVLGKLSFTLDCWTSINNVDFLVIICHFVDVYWFFKFILFFLLYFSFTYYCNLLYNDFMFINFFIYIFFN